MWLNNCVVCLNVRESINIFLIEYLSKQSFESQISWETHLAKTAHHLQYK